MIDLRTSVASVTRRIPFILTACLLLLMGVSQATPVQGAACIVPPSGMTGWWPGDDNTNDITSFADHGTLMNSATYVPGKVASAFSLTGASDYVNVPNAPQLNPGTGDFSIDAWVQTSAASGTFTFLDKRTVTVNAAGASVVNGYSLFVSNGRLGMQLADGGWSNYIATTGPIIADGGWHHVAALVTRGSATGGTLFVDGAVVLTFDPTGRSGSLTNTADLRFGESHLSASTQPVAGHFLNFQGLVDEVEFFNRVLDFQEVRNIYNADSAGKCKPKSMPVPVGPPDGFLSVDLAPLLQWTNPPGTTQYQIQVIPARNDGPGINLIRNVETSYQVQAPILGTGNYVILPGMSYTWRVRTTQATVPVGENDPGWSEWAEPVFKTAPPSSAGIRLVSPAEGSTVESLTPTLRWDDTDIVHFYYEVEVSKDPAFNNDPNTAIASVYRNLIHGGESNPLNSYAIPADYPLEPDSAYYLRVRPRVQGDGIPVAWSPTGMFKTGPSMPSYADGVVLVRFQPDSSPDEREQAWRSAGAVSSEPLSPLAVDAEKLTLGEGVAVDRAIQELSRNPIVVYAEPDYRVTHQATSNDTYYTNGSLWGMYGDATSPANQYGSQAAEAWAAGHTGSSTVYVGIIDEGIQFTHPDLAANFWTNPADLNDGLDNDGNGYIDDVHGWDFFSNDNSIYDGTADDHGTHVAGTIGAKGGNGTGVAGVNWNVTLISAKFLGPSGGYISSAVQAADYLTDLKKNHGLNIVVSSNSWGGGGFSQSMLDAINRGGDEGILFVAAAGNNGGNNDSTPNYPSNYQCVTRFDTQVARGWDCVIAVASITSTGAKSSFSQYGMTTVDIGAPGSGIYSTVPTSSYASYNGTSMATPHVSGAAALCASIGPTLTAQQIKSAILSTAVPTTSLAVITVTGGRLDVGSMAGACQVVAAGPDLYIKDTLADTGTEPNPATGPMWVSEDIWVQPAQDPGYQPSPFPEANPPWTPLPHQNPEYRDPQSGLPNYLYVRVHNRGNAASSGTEQLKLNWAKASTGLSWPTQWVNYVVNGILYGAEITANAPVVIPVLQPGQAVVMQIPWYPPNPADFASFGADQGHFCLLARIETSTGAPFGMTFPEGAGVYANTKNNNNIAWKNLTVVDVVPGGTKLTSVIVRNVSRERVVPTGLRFEDPAAIGASFFDSGRIQVDLKPELFERWRAGGAVGKGIEIVGRSTLRITSPTAAIENIMLEPGEAVSVDISFELFADARVPQGGFPKWDLIQIGTPENRTAVVGGQRFEVRW